MKYKKIIKDKSKIVDKIKVCEIGKVNSWI